LPTRSYPMVTLWRTRARLGPCELRSGRHGLVLGAPTFPWRLSLRAPSLAASRRLYRVSSPIRRCELLLAARRARRVMRPSVGKGSKSPCANLTGSRCSLCFDPVSSPARSKAQRTRRVDIWRPRGNGHATVEGHVLLLSAASNAFDPS